MYRDDLRVPFALAKHDVPIERGLTRAHVADAFRSARFGDGAGAVARLAVRVTADKRGRMAMMSNVGSATGRMASFVAGAFGSSCRTAGVARGRGDAGGQ